MTRVRYDEKSLTMELSGHAGYGPVGCDIVCAAVSILSQTLIRNLEKFSDRGWYVLEYELDGGECYIHCKASGYYSMIVEMFRFTMEGLKMLAEEYPQHVQIIETGGMKDGDV